ncbi:MULTISPECIES: multidrug DMT transporter permease [Legionella]|uniref:Multidrug DMT transporter permease n=1 Tax=Legionella septentrionalis TaxID=2498109 RepID=A0A3S0X149_9GAMM|nr:MULTISPECIES: multidrug DMT transporter permease [Legionella]MCP0914498.1 multidrug DMT transporter permease [Legionella sp. 27cVA30]RUQ89441.1 multidrug DMT transporter permease [Legionella septentrionalis]RUQ95603.1 multidrug DMT transporter permease [Legionella septentrionalis]RUR10454.1 multidrug DMT transporter permease [Legionella septentrionalis]RUR16074.1 multidrug DMT transporter permease [Legionella septentrionalis]
MMMEKLIGSQSIIITLDVDALLFDKLKQIAQAGYSVVEINCVDPVYLSTVLKDFPMLRIGAGNIIDVQQLENCYQAGVHFVTSPGFLPAIAQTANIYSINYLPGVATLSEAMQAMALGCHYVRPYPADLTFCTLLNKCLPLLRLFPAEIEMEEAEHFLNLPAVAAVSILNPESKHLRALEPV